MGQIRRHLSAVIAVFVGFTILSVLSYTKATADSLPEVTDVRVGEHKYKTRLVLDITRPVDLRYEVSANGKAVFIDLPGISWSADKFTGRHYKGLVNDFRFSPNAEGGRLNVLTNSPVRIKRPFFVGPKGRLGHRIVIDMMRDRSSLPIAAHQPLRTTHLKRVSSSAPQTSFKISEMVAGPGAMPHSEAPPEIEAVLPSQRNNPPQIAQNGQRVPAQIFRQEPVIMPVQNNPTSYENHGGILGFQNIYLKGQIGVRIVPEITNSGNGNENTMELDPGLGFTGGLGINLDNNFRVEGELTYATNSIKRVTGTGNGSSFRTTYTGGDISSLAFMGNVAYDFASQNRFTPYVLGGAGFFSLATNDIKADDTVISDSSDFVLGMQIGAGVSVPLDDVTTLEVAYRYIETQNPEFGDQRGLPFTTEIASHDLVLGARLKF